MNNEELLVDIQLLIEAYEAGLNKNITVNPVFANVHTGYQLPLTTMELAVEASVVAANLSFAEMILESPSLVEKKLDNEVKSSEKAFEDKEYLYQECSITDIDGKAVENNEMFVNETRSEYSFEKGVAYTKKRYINDFKMKLGYRVTEKLDDALFGKDRKVSTPYGDLNFGIEKCFDCVVKIDLEFALPALEFTFDFSKQLQRIKNLLKQIDDDLNPTKLFEFVCKFSLGFGQNLICPSNLAAINLMLPALFGKYSLDLAKIRLDWTVVLGPIIKTVIGTFVPLVENIPRMITPFIDCIVNALNATVKYIETILTSAENVYNSIHNGVEKVVNSIVSSLKTTRSILEDLDIIDTELESLEKDYLELADEILQKEKERDKKLPEIREKYYKEALTKFLMYMKKGLFSGTIEEKYSFDGTVTYELVESLFVDWLSIGENQQYLDVILHAEPQEFKEYVDLKNQYKEALKQREEMMAKADSEYRELLDDPTHDDRYFRLQFVADNKPLSYPGSYSHLKEKEDLFVAKIIADGDFNSDDEIRAAANAARKVFRQANTSKPGRTRNKPDYTFGINDQNSYDLDQKKPIEFKRNPEDKFDWYDWLFAKYGLDIENRYMHGGVSLPGKIDFGTKRIVKNIRDFLNEYVIKHLLELKNFILRTTNEAILSLKNIEKFLGDFVETDIKVLGNIQELMHVIRFIRLIYNLVTNGLEGCDKIKENKEVFKSILQEQNKELIYDDEILTRKNLSQDDFIALRSKDGIYETIVDLNDCSEAITHLNVTENSLEGIYDGILNGLYR